MNGWEMLCKLDSLLDLSLLDLMRMKYPSVSKYGNDAGGDARLFLAAVRDQELMERLVGELFKIECAYLAKVGPLREAMAKAENDRRAALKALMETF